MAIPGVKPGPPRGIQQIWRGGRVSRMAQGRYTARRTPPNPGPLIPAILFFLFSLWIY